MITVKRKVFLVRRERGLKALSSRPAPRVTDGRVPRVAKLMALAVTFDRLIRAKPKLLVRNAPIVHVNSATPNQSSRVALRTRHACR